MKFSPGDRVVMKRGYNQGLSGVVKYSMGPLVHVQLDHVPSWAQQSVILSEDDLEYEVKPVSAHSLNAQQSNYKPGDDLTDFSAAWLPTGISYNLGPTDEERKRRKEAGECEECGKLRPMSIHGLLDCPDHPKEQKGYV